MKPISIFPDSLLKCSCSQIHQFAEDLSLFHIKGSKPEALFISTLLHGNETSGFLALQKFLQHNKLQPLERDVIILLGNVSAARTGHRLLEGQSDYNRIWTGLGGKEAERAKQILDYIQNNKLFCMIDIHNSSGRNPPYVAINSKDRNTIEYARFISNITVYFKEPHTALSAVLSNICPAITFEAGLPGDVTIIDNLVNFLNQLIHLESFPKVDHNFYLLHSYARMIVPRDASFDFSEHDLTSDFNFNTDLDCMNFKEIIAGTCIGKSNSKKRLIVLNERDENVADQYFTYENGQILTLQNFIPSLISLDKEIVRQDVLGYIMREELL